MSEVFGPGETLRVNALAAQVDTHFPLAAPGGISEKVRELIDTGQLSEAANLLARLDFADRAVAEELTAGLPASEDTSTEVQAFLRGLYHGRAEGAHVVESWKTELGQLTDPVAFADALRDPRSRPSVLIHEAAISLTEKALREVRIYGGFVVRKIMDHRKINGRDSATVYAGDAIERRAQETLKDVLHQLGFSATRSADRATKGRIDIRR